MHCQFFNTKYSKDIIAKAKSNFIAGMDWKDIAQELDIALWKALPRYAGRNGAKESTYAQTVMRNRIINLKKATKRDKRAIDVHSILFSDLEDTIQGQIQLETSVSIFDLD